MIADARLGEIARELRTGAVSPRAYLDGLRERFDSVEPTIEAFLAEDDRWDRLGADVARLAEQYPDPGTRPALFGVPVGVKDIFHADGFETRAGSPVPADELAGPEAATVSALVDAGAVVLGKTVTTEFAYFEPGPTRNPHDPDHTPGGSSSGSAAAVAAGLCPMALGSQTIGSVNRPAAFCGIVGVKPSYGRISIEGVLPVAPSVDHVGYFTQDVSGALLAAGVLYDEWRAEDAPGRDPVIGALQGPYLEQASETGRDHFDRHVDRLAGDGFDVRPIEPVPEIDAVNRRHNQLVAAETALSHNRLYPKYGDQYAQKTADLIEDGLAVDVESLGSARAGRLALREAVHASMDERGVDVLVSPAAPGPAPPGIDTTGDPIMNLPWTHSGLPTVTLPASMTSAGLPIGLQCTARFGYDEWLLRWCRDVRPALA